MLYQQMCTLQSRTSTKNISIFKQSDLPTAANRAPRAGQTANCFNPSSMILQGGQDTGVACGACTQARAISGRPGFCVKQGRLQGSGLPGDTKHKDPVRDTHRMKRTVLSQGCISRRNHDSYACYTIIFCTQLGGQFWATDSIWIDFNTVPTELQGGQSTLQGGQDMGVACGACTPGLVF